MIVKNRCFQRAVEEAQSSIVILFARLVECQLLSDVIVHRRHFLTSCDCTLPSHSNRSTCILHLCSEKKIVTSYQHYCPPPSLRFLTMKKSLCYGKARKRRIALQRDVFTTFNHFTTEYLPSVDLILIVKMVSIRALQKFASLSFPTRSFTANIRLHFVSFV